MVLACGVSCLVGRPVTHFHPPTDGSRIGVGLVVCALGLHLGGWALLILAGFRSTTPSAKTFGLLLTAALLLHANAFAASNASAWAWAAGLQALSWVVQVYVGHVVFEKRKPALLDSIVQAFLLAPLFCVLELGFALGYRPKLKATVEAKARADIAAWKASKAA